MVLPDLLRIIFGGLGFLLIVGIALTRRRKNDTRARGLLAAAQIALAMPLVICVGLLIRNEIQLRSIYPGVGGEAARIAMLALRTDKYGAPEQRNAFFDHVKEQLAHVPGIQVADTGTGLPLVDDDYFALYFLMGDQPALQPPMGQRFIIWRADINPDSLATEVNNAVKTFDRGIHYSKITQQSPQNMPIMIAFGAYAALSLLLIAVNLRGETLHRVGVWVISGIVIGLGASAAITHLLTGLLFGVSVTNHVVFALSAALITGVALSTCIMAKKPSQNEK